MRKNRPYKKGEPFRDARLFVIACEGEKREKVYFEHLGNGSRRLKVEILSAERGSSLSAPKWVVDRLVRFIETNGVNLQKGDIVWLVMDVDQWKPDDLIQLAKDCKMEGWGFALSNPCFEVWLLMHLGPIADLQARTCREMKQTLDKLVKGGYKVEDFIPLIEDAIRHASTLTDDPQRPIPEFRISRVHLPVKQMKEYF